MLLTESGRNKMQTHGAIWQNEPPKMGGKGGFKTKLSPVQNTQPSDGNYWKHTERVCPCSACLIPVGKARRRDHMGSGI